VGAACKQRVSEVLSNLPTVSALFTPYSTNVIVLAFISVSYTALKKGNACETRITNQPSLICSRLSLQVELQTCYPSLNKSKPTLQQLLLRQATSNDSQLVVILPTIVLLSEPLRSPCSHDCRVCSHRTFRKPRRVIGPLAVEDTDFTA